MGDASTCGQCSPTEDSPNRDKSADATASILAHEIFEAITNPDPTRPAYIGSDGKEVHVFSHARLISLECGQMQFLLWR